MKKIYPTKIIYLLIAGFMMVSTFVACEKMFIDDGDASVGINGAQKYLYIIENGTKDLLMLDVNLNLIQRWDLSGLVEDNDVRGVVCDDKFLWISVSGAMDQIVKLASDGDTIMALSSMEAPPNGKGTIRELAWDGKNLWALNSGSSSSGVPGQVFKIDTQADTVIQEYNLSISDARGLTYAGNNGDVYGRGVPMGLYVTDVKTDKVYLLDQKTNFYEYFNMPLHPRGVFYTSPASISFSDSSFFVINVSGSSGHYLYKMRHKGSGYNIEVLDMLNVPYNNPTAMHWSDFDFRQGIETEIWSVLPATAKIGESLVASITGQGFTESMNVSFGDDIEVGEVTYESSSKLVVDISISQTASTGERDVVLTKADGQSVVGAAMLTIVEQNPLDGYILYCDNNDGSVNRIRIADQSLVDKWYPDFLDAGSLQGMEYHNEFMWISSGGSSDEVFRCDSVDFSVQSSIPAPPDQTGTVREVAFNSKGELWVLNSGTDLIYQVDKTSGDVLSSIPVPVAGGNARGIVFADDVLYCNDKNTDFIYAYDFSAKSWSEAFEMPIPPNGSAANRFSTGMTWDGVNFWIGNSTYAYDYLMQISPAGNLLQSIPVPNIGDAKISGVAFTY